MPPNKRTAVAESTSLEWTDNNLSLNLLSFKSCQTIKPMPPKMTSAEIVKRIIGSLLTVVSEDEGEKTPIKSKYTEQSGSLQMYEKGI